MKHIVLSTLLLITSAVTAQADCFVHYKAKQESPLKLHYGISQIGNADCTIEAANRVISERLAVQGWSLLNIVKVSTQNPNSEEQANAGEYFLRF